MYNIVAIQNWPLVLHNFFCEISMLDTTSIIKNSPDWLRNPWIYETTVKPVIEESPSWLTSKNDNWNALRVLRTHFFISWTFSQSWMKREIFAYFLRLNAQVCGHANEHLHNRNFRSSDSTGLVRKCACLNLFTTPITLKSRYHETKYMAS